MSIPSAVLPWAMSNVSLLLSLLRRRLMPALIVERPALASVWTVGAVVFPSYQPKAEPIIEPPVIVTVLAAMPSLAVALLLKLSVPLLIVILVTEVPLL